jgi:hypothetical protein
MLLSSRSAVAARPPPNQTPPSSRPRALYVSPVGSPAERRHTRMRRALLLVAGAVAALAVALPATAGAATTFRGVVIAKDSARKSLVTASRNGGVRTVRARAAFGRVRVGRLIAVRAAALPDGTFAASKIRLLGIARHAHFRATVVVRKGARLVVSAGRSVFVLHVRAGKTASSDGSGGLGPGDEVDCDAVVKGGSLETRAGDLDKVGHADQLVLEGIYLATADDGTIELAVVHRGRVFVKVPEKVVAPSFEAGDEIAVVVKVEADGSFTFVKAENENSAGDEEGDDDGVDIDGPKGEYTVVGVLAALSDDSVAVKVADRREPVRCAVADGFDLSGFAVGQRVLMSCKFRDGRPVLIALKKKTETEYVETTGTISELADDAITVQPDGHEPVSCAVPEEFDLSDYEVGDLVVMFCKKLDGAWTLKAIKNKLPEPPPIEYVYVTGTITVLSPSSIAVQGDGDPLTCAVPEEADLGDFAVGDAVTMKCVHGDAGLRLWRLASETAEYTAP